MREKNSEKQEWGLINTITQYTQKYPVTINSSKCTIEDVYGAVKHDKINGLGKEPMVDIQLHTKSVLFNVSAKAKRSPNLGGGGLLGLLHMIPEVVTSFLYEAENWYLSNGFNTGDKQLPDLFSKVPIENIINIIKGTTTLGGPVDYMYVGPSNVEHDYCQTSKSLKFNGEFIPVLDYVKEHTFFLRLRKRRRDVEFIPGLRDKNNLPLIFSKSIKGEWGRRIMVTNEMTGEII